jgi:hypothetical protein
MTGGGLLLRCFIVRLFRNEDWKLMSRANCYIYIYVYVYVRVWCVRARARLSYIRSSAKISKILVETPPKSQDITS